MKLRRPNVRVIVHTDRAGPWWTLAGANGEVLAASEIYSSETACWSRAEKVAREIGVRAEAE